MMMMMKCMPSFWKGACNRSVDFIDHSHRCLAAVPDDVLRCAATLEELILDSNQIRDLPPSFFSLSQLRKLSLNDNQVARLTNDIGNLTNLQELDVSHNELMYIPENIKQCRNLQIADFSSNPLKDLPEGLTQLKTLTHLILNDVAIQRLPEEIGSLTNLESLELRDNLLSQFPSSLGRLVNLQFLDAGSNMIEEVPGFIGLLCNLEELRFDCNEILELPAELGELKKLTQLDMSDNNLKQLPQEIGGLTSLTDLHLSRNQLEFLPDGIGSLQKLCTLKVDQNHLLQLTPAIGNCCALQELILTENLLTELPGSVGKLKSLTILNVDRNRLTNIPPKIGGCMRLGVLSLRENVLWRLPPELGYLKELHVLDVSGNRLQHLPLSFGTCNLKALWLSENQAQPLLKFQQDVDVETGEKVLTCFLLPQQAFTDSMENLLKDSFAVMSEHDSRFSWLDHTRGSSVKFAEDDREHVSDDEIQKEPESLSGDENHFVRQNTPHPKDLRVHRSKLFIKDVDGHMIPHKQKKESDSGFVPSHDHVSSVTMQRDSLSHSLNTDGHTIQNEEDCVAVDEGDASHDKDYMSHDNALVEIQPGNDAFDADQTDASLRKSQNDVDGLNEMSHIDGHQQVVAETPNSKLMTIRMMRSAGIGLGISIAGGRGSHPFVDNDEGIFISKVNLNGLAEKEGLLVGDKILSVNGMSLVNVEHSRAVAALRTAGYDITLVIVRTSATDSQEEMNGASVAHDSAFDFSGGVTKPASVIKTASRSVEFVKTSDSHVPLNPATEVNSDQTTQRNSLRLPDTILKIHEENEVSRDAFERLKTEEFSTPTGKSALTSSAGDWKTVEKTNPFVRDARCKKPSPESCPSSIGESNSPGKTTVLHYQTNRSPQLKQQSSSALTSISHNPRIKSELLQNQAEDAFGSAVKTESPRSYDDASSETDSTSAKETSQISLSDSASLLASITSPAITRTSDVYPKETVVIVKAGGPLGLSIVGGRGHTSHPFGIDEPGIFISKIQPFGAAAKTLKLRIGDRILAVNGQCMENASHQEAVMSLVDPTYETVLEVRHDPQPPGMKEVVIHKARGERLGLSIAGGAGTPCGNVADITDEGIFISRIIAGTVAARDGRLSVGMRILEVNGQSLLGATQQESAQMLQAAGNSLALLLCHGFDVVQPKHGLSTGREVPSKESEILTPSLNKPPAFANPLFSPPDSCTKTVFDKNLEADHAVTTDHSPALRNIPAETNRDGVISSGELTVENATVDSNSYPLRPANEDVKSVSNDVSKIISTTKHDAASEKNLSAEEERRMRAEQRRITRLKFLQEAASKTRETSKVLKDFPHSNLQC